VKRVTAVAGETVRASTGTMTVARGHCWVNGIRTAHSEDSNQFGQV
jgi:hypothetical protein